MYLASMTRSHWSVESIFINMIDFLIDFTSEWNEISVFSKMFKGRKTTSTNKFKHDRKSNQISTLF